MASITLKNIPEELHARFRQRAEKNRRSLQAEILKLMEDADFDLADEEKLEPKDLVGILQHNSTAFSVEEMDESVS